MRKKLNPSSDPLPLEDSAVTDPKIIPDVEQPFTLALIAPSLRQSSLIGH